MNIKGLAILALMWAVPVLADDNRTIDASYASTMPTTELMFCLGEWGARYGAPRSMQTATGGEIDFWPKMQLTGFGTRLGARITDDGTMRHVTLVYRRPYSGEYVEKALRKSAKKCGGVEIAAAQ